MLGDLEREYAEFMTDKTGRDEYSCKVNMYEHPLPENRDEGCGGVVVYNHDCKIWCQNTINTRMEQAIVEMMPQVRAQLFPKA